MHVNDFPVEIRQLQYGGQIKGFPPEIVELMLQRQFEQKGKRDISVFEEDRSEGSENDENGFTWRKTVEGYYFWKNVIQETRFHLFFEKYPKQGFINSHIKTNENEQSTHSIKVCKPVATITTGKRQPGIRVSGRSSKTAIGSGHLSYEARVGH